MECIGLLIGAGALAPFACEMRGIMDGRGVALFTPSFISPSEPLGTHVLVGFTVHPNRNKTKCLFRSISLKNIIGSNPVDVWRTHEPRARLA